MKTRSTAAQSRRARRSILISAIVPAALATVSQGADVTWNTTQTLLLNPTYQAGLHEGRLNGAFNETDPNPNTNITLLPRLAEDNGKPPWGDNETWIYTGEVNAGPNGTLSFAENIDDNVLLKIDGVQVLRDTQWNVVTTTGVLNFAPNSYHTFELRVANGGGGAGPVNQNGFANDYGFGRSVTGATSNQGTDYQKPVDPGTGSVFRFLLGNAGGPDFIGGDTVHVTGTTTVTLQNVTTNTVTENLISFEPAGTSLSFVVNRDNAAQPSTLRSVATTIPASKTVTVSGSADFAPGSLTVGANGILLLNNSAATGSLIFDTASTFAAGSKLRIGNGLVSVVGAGGGSNPIASLANAVELGQSTITGTPVIRIGSVNATTSTTFGNLIDVKNNGTIEHTAGSSDVLSGDIGISNAKTLTTNVTGGSLVITGKVNGIAASLNKTGNATLRLTNADLDGVTVSAGRLEVSGRLKLPNNPVIANGATLALTNTANVLADNTGTVISIPSGTLEGVGGAFGDSNNLLALTGGTLRLAGASPGLTGTFYQGNDGSANASIANGYAAYTSYFESRVPNAIAATSNNGVTELSFNPDGDGDAPFTQVTSGAFNFADNIVSRMSGKIFIATAGNYTFGTTSDDGSVIYIDRSSTPTVNNNFYQGMNRRTGTVALSAGYHDIDIAFYEGGGGAGLIADYSLSGGFGQTTIPNSVLFTSSNEAFANPIDVQQNSTIDVTGSLGVHVASLTVQPGRTLTVTGQSMTADTVTLNGAGTYTFSGDGTVVATTILDGGADVDIVKAGSGVLVLDNTTTPQLQNSGSSVTVTGGQVGLLLQTGGLNPLGNASINFNGGGLVLSSKGGDQSFALPVFNGNGAVIARQVGSGVNGPVNIALTGNLGVGPGQTVTLGTANGYTITLGGTPTVSGGTVNVTGTGVRLTTAGALNGMNVIIGADAAGSLRLDPPVVAPATTPTVTSFASLAGGVSSSLVAGNGTNPVTLNLGGGTNARFNGVISEQSGSVLSLVKTGSNTQTLAGLSTFTGGVTVNAGTLELRSGAIGSNSINLTGGATLQFISSGLLGQFYTGDDGGAHNAFAGPDFPANTFTTYNNYFANRTAPVITTSTDSGGVITLDYQGAPQFGAYGLNNDDNIVSRMSGRILIPTTGNYTFGTSSDDGSMLFIDGGTVVGNNVYQGRTRRTGTVALTAGLHNIDIGFFEGGGGNSLTVDWAGPGFGTQNLPNSVLENNTTTFNGAANVVNLTGNGTLDLRGGNVILGDLTQTSGTTLTATAGQVTFSNANLGGTTFNYAGAGTIALLQVTDGSNPVTINRTGGGNLVLGSPALAQLTNGSSSLNASGGSLIVGVASDLNPNAPLGVAAVNLNGGGLGLSSASGNVSFSNPVNLVGNGSIAAGNFGGGAINGPITATLSAPVTVGSGRTLTVSSANNYTLELNGIISGAGNVTASGGTVVTSGALNITGVLAVTGGSLSAVNTVNAASIAVTNGTLATLGSAISSTSGTTINGGGTVDLQNGTIGGAVTLNGGTLLASTGTNDLNGATVTVNPVVPNTVANKLQAKAYSGFTNPTGGYGSDLGIATTLARIPTATVELAQDLNVPNDAAFNAFFGTTLADQFTAVALGNFKAPSSGAFTFGIGLNDDSASVWVDLNQNGVFENAGSAGNEKIVTRGCCGGDVNNTQNGTVNLVANQSYRTAIVVEDTGGGSSLGAKWDVGAIASGPNTLGKFVNPGDPAQAGVWSYDASTGGGTVRVESGATLAVGAISNGDAVLLNGSGATLRIGAGGLSSSNVNNLTLLGNGVGALDIGNAETLGVARLNITPGATLQKIGNGVLNVGLQNLGTNAAFETQGGTTTISAFLTVGASTITNTAGTLNMNGNAVGSSVDVKGATNFGASQTLASLTIEDGGVATLTPDAPAPAPSFSVEGFGGGEGSGPTPIQAVPEPGSLSLLAVGVLGLFGRRRRK